jgi:hypothetical protein
MTVVTVNNAKGRGHRDLVNHPSLVSGASLDPVQETYLRQLILDGFALLEVEKNGLQGTAFTVSVTLTPGNLSMSIS